MRVSLSRVALCTAAVGVMTVAGTSLAATKVVTPVKTKPVTITDQAGDANAVNGEGFTTVPATATPAQDAGADILSISWQTLVKNRALGGMQVVMTLSAPPQTQTIYRATGGTSDCTTFQFNYAAFADGATATSLQDNCPGFTPSSATSTTETVKLSPAVISGNTITWTLPKNLVPAGFKPGAALTGLGGHTRLYAGTSLTGGATVPQLDEAAGPGTFIYGK